MGAVSGSDITEGKIKKARLPADAVYSADARLTDARTPTAHTQAASTITDFSTAVAALIPTATDTVAGKVELATSAETITGTDLARATTPAGVKAALGDDVTSLFTIIAAGTSGFTTTLRAWRTGKLIACQITVSGTPAYAAWQSRQIMTVPVGLRPGTQAGGTLTWLALTAPFMALAETSGSVTIGRDGTSGAFPGGVFAATLTWITA